MAKKSKDGNYIEKKKEESGNITYIYDKKHIDQRNKKKAEQLKKLSKSFSKLRDQLKKDVLNEDFKIRLPALAIALMDETYERVGNRYSASDMEHYGITTLLVKHIKFLGSKATLKYVGKSGVKQNKIVKNSKVVSQLKKLCKGKKPNDPILEFEDYTLNDNHVNQYLRPFNITAKDIRGLHANVEVRKQLQKMKKGKDEKERKEIFKKAVEEAAKIVGHEPSTLKNQYLIPGFAEKYITKGEIIGPKKASSEFDLIKEGGHTSAMLAIMLPKDVVKKLKKMGFVSKNLEEDNDDLHITLVFLGKAKDLKNSIEYIKRATEKVCAKHFALNMNISGSGVFNKGKNGTPVFLIPNAKGLSALQADLESAVSNIIDLPSEHGWSPHITVSYLKNDEFELPRLDEKIEWKCDMVRLQSGGKSVGDFKLSNFKLSKRAG